MSEYLPFWSRHVGPYVLRVSRPHPTRAGHWTGEKLNEEHQHGADAEAEARALLSDPRDTVAFVNVWSVSEEAFVGGYRR